MLSIAMLMILRQHNIGGDGRKGTEIPIGGPAVAGAAGAVAYGAAVDATADPTATADDELVYEPVPSIFSTRSLPTAPFAFSWVSG
jgi:hypothetical protein